MKSLPEDTNGLLEHEVPSQTLSTLGRGRPLRMLAGAAGFVAVAGIGAVVFMGSVGSGPGRTEDVLGMVELLKPKECTGEHQDPWSTGSMNRVAMA